MLCMCGWLCDPPATLCLGSSTASCRCTLTYECYLHPYVLATGREVYQGMFGPWSIEPADEFEVLTYRVGLTATMAGRFHISAAAAGRSIQKQQHLAAVATTVHCSKQQHGHI
jgi:hypothetical protein